MIRDHLLDVVLDVITEADPGSVFGAGEVLRAARPALEPVPTLAEVERVLALLALPMLGGVVPVGDGLYRGGVAGVDVLRRLAQLSEAVRQVDEDDLEDRY